ncbi:hypothetical protein Plhal304r1_c086g0169081 [Plasmopara halstedii]
MWQMQPGLTSQLHSRTRPSTLIDLRLLIGAPPNVCCVTQKERLGSVYDTTGAMVMRGYSRYSAMREN